MLIILLKFMNGYAFSITQTVFAINFTCYLKKPSADKITVDMSLITFNT